MKTLNHPHLEAPNRSAACQLVTLVALLMSLARADAQHALTYSVFGRTGNGTPSVFYNSSYALGSTFWSPPVINPASGDLRALANGGVNYGFIFSEVGLVSSGQGNGVASAFFSFNDRVTISSAGLAGEIGLYTARMHITGRGYAEEPAAWGSTRGMEARYVFQATSSTNFLLAQRSQTWTSPDGGGRAESDIDEYVDLVVPMVFGTPNPFSVSLNLTATEFGATGGGVLPTGAAGADFVHTVAWLGITEVRDAQGNLVTDYTATSSAGVDWTRAMPTAPALQILPLPGGRARISWPVTSGPLVLRYSDTLAPLNTWIGDTNAVFTNGPFKGVTVWLTNAPTRFYTLGVP